MTLKQAFTIWANTPQNISLAAKYRNAANTVLFKKYNDVDLEVFTKGFTERLFAQCDATQELKTKAASVLVYLLSLGAERGHCKEPDFDYTIASNKIDVKKDYDRPSKIAVYYVDREAQMEFQTGKTKVRKTNKAIITKPMKESKNNQDLTLLSNDELIEEIKRRGWKGNITMTVNIQL